jgi:4,4'-diaponeurosporenoate glycosyltransferase
VNIGRMDDAAWTTVVEFAPYAIGWVTGWALLWRLRPLPSPVPARGPIAVVVPARNEADSLPRLLPALLTAARPGDEVVVVDDHSTDATAEVAARLGATVTTPPDLAAGWLGKPNACWHGANSTSAGTLVFLDADTQPSVDLLDRIAAAVHAHPGEVVSVQPYHVPGRPAEHLSMLFNITALMGVGRFSIWGTRAKPRAAFGPVLAIERTTYERVGGHAHPDVRAKHTEDIALARLVGAAQLYTGRPDVCFRMYPGGARELVRGWTRSVATGARSVPWWLAMATAAWVWSLAGGMFVSPWLYLTSAVQVLVLSRRAGRFSPAMAALYPLALAVFVLVFVRSAVAVVLRREVAWKQRRVAAR